MSALAPGTIDRYNEFLKRLLSAKGEPLEGVAPELIISLDVEQAPATAWEYFFLLGATRYSSLLQQTAVPAGGLFSGVELRNPVGSGVLVTLEYAAIVGTVTSSYNLGIDQVALGGGVGFGVALDTREITGKKSASQLRITAGSAVTIVTDGNAIEFEQSGSPTEEQVPFKFAPGIIIAPGHAVQIGARVAAVATGALFLFRERQLGASELVRA